MKMSELAGDVAVVTGATSGIGKAIVLGLAELGTKLCLIGRNPSKLAETAAEIGDTASRVACYHADLGIPAEISAASSDIQRDFGAVDVLVHSAGTIALDAIDQLPVEELDHQYAVNVRAPYLLTRLLLPAMRNGHAQIVFVNSTAGLFARANASQYAATKHGLRAIADSLREEVNPRGIRVLSVFLGRTSTPMQKNVHQMEGRQYRPEILMQAEDVATTVIAALRLPRTAEVTDITMRPLVKSY
jgi:short-subunit dehydrogenase